MKIIYYFLTNIIFLISINSFSQEKLISNNFSKQNLYDRSYLKPYFKEAAIEFNIPVEILEAIGFVESHWVQRFPDIVSKGDIPNAYGVMGLRNDEYFGYSLIESSKIINCTKEDLINNPLQNIRGAAAFLRNIAESESLKGKIVYNYLDWIPVIEIYSGIPQSEVRKIYSTEVIKLLQTGYDNYGIKINKIENIEINIFNKEIKEFSTIGCSGTTWNSASTCNYGVGRGGYSVNKIIIHSTEGTFASAISWFQNCTAGVSAHYVVGNNGSSIYQMVDENNTAWHAGNSVYNKQSIGIEIAGYASDPSYFNSSVLQAVANLCICDCNYWGIAKNRVNIIGHNQVPDENNSNLWGGVSHKLDPGGYFSWDYLMPLVTNTLNSYQQLKITTSSLNVRTGPSSSSPLLTTVQLNQEFVSYYKDNSSGWYLIFVPGFNSYHFDGWISGSYVQQLSCQNQIKIVNAWPTPVNIRNGNSTSYSVIDKVIDDQKYVAISKNNGWYNFHTPTSVGSSTAWCSGSYVNEMCGFLGVENFLNEFDFAVYPNPTTDNIEIKISEDILIKKLVIYNELGQTLINIDNPSKKIFTDTLPQGLFLVKIEDSKNRIAVTKLIKN